MSINQYIVALTNGLTPWQKVIVLISLFILVGFVSWLILGNWPHDEAASLNKVAHGYTPVQGEYDSTKPLRNLMQIVADFYPYLILIMVFFVVGNTYVNWVSAFKAAFVGGMFLCAAGVAMMYQGIVTDGVMDLKTQFFSGSIRSSSAGFIVFVIGSAFCLSAIWRLGRKGSSD
jgi:hypothetical protein